MDRTDERVWAEISVENLKFNFHQAKKHSGGRTIMPVIKANAYGHGSVAVARILSEEGAECFAVSAPYEAMELRKFGVTQPLLILGAVPPTVIPMLLAQNISLAVSSYASAEQYSKQAQGSSLQIHIKLDTGMSRYGIQVSKGIAETVEEVKKILSLPNLVAEGLFTHFAVADANSGREFTAAQIERFEQVRMALSDDGIRFPLYHCANSAGIIRYPVCHYTMVREGIMLYGTAPDIDLQNEIELRPVMSLKTVVEQVKTLDAGETIGYGRTYTCASERTIAVLSVGYADGLFRNGSGSYQFLLNGKRIRQVGKVCMDICMADVTDLPTVKVGDIVTVFGSDGANHISIEEYARTAGTFNYEALCAISVRVPRYYI